MARSYPRGYAVRVERDDWVSQWDVSGELGVGLLRVGWLVANGHLEPAETEGELFGIDLRGPAMGVTRASLDKEKLWRGQTSWWRRWRRGIGDCLGWALSGI